MQILRLVAEPAFSYKLLDVQSGSATQAVSEGMVGKGETAVKQQPVDQLLACIQWRWRKSIAY